jgi:NAD-dependent SIR2 family protein deacetylase
MMTQCPQCGSNEIIPDLVLFGNEVPSYQAFVSLVDPHPHHTQEGFAAGILVAICGACGHIKMFTNWNKELLEEYKKRLVTEKV